MNNQISSNNRSLGSTSSNVSSSFVLSSTQSQTSSTSMNTSSQLNNQYNNANFNLNLPISKLTNNPSTSPNNTLNSSLFCSNIGTNNSITNLMGYNPFVSSTHANNFSSLYNPVIQTKNVTDHRSSSIATLRLKAREHSVALGSI